jgi:hypothetical protein
MEAADMAWSGWRPEMPVIVAGVENGKITHDGKGYQEFGSLADAQSVFPDLDPQKNSERFTWAMAGGTSEGRDRIRFETWKANELYST